MKRLRCVPVGKALIIEHDETGPVGGVGERLIERGFELHPFRVLEDFSNPLCTKEFPDPTDFDVVVVLGSLWSVYDKGPIESWVDREIELVRKAHRTGIPVLGLCFGGQVLSAALGGEVTRAAQPEIGWYEIETDLPEVVSSGPWLEWHYDKFTVPDGAVEVARTKVSSQVFRAGKSVGTQFHPEITPDIVTNWVTVGQEELSVLQINPKSIVADSVDYQVDARQRADRLVDWFLS